MKNFAVICFLAIAAVTSVQEIYGDDRFWFEEARGNIKTPKKLSFFEKHVVNKASTKNYDDQDWIKKAEKINKDQVYLPPSNVFILVTNDEEFQRSLIGGGKCHGSNTSGYTKSKDKFELVEVWTPRGSNTYLVNHNPNVKWHVCVAVSHPAGGKVVPTHYQGKEA